MLPVAIDEPELRELGVAGKQIGISARVRGRRELPDRDRITPTGERFDLLAFREVERAGAALEAVGVARILG